MITSHTVTVTVPGGAIEPAALILFATWLKIFHAELQPHGTGREVTARADARSRQVTARADVA